MASIVQYFTEGSRIFLTSWKNRVISKRYPGSAQEICQQIVKDCWNGHFFQTSTGNFPEFWTRDFGWCTSSLLKLGFEKEVDHTLRYALNHFKEHQKITTTITPAGTPYDFPTMAVDSLPWLIHSMRLAKFSPYSFKDFLNKEIQKYADTVINPATGLVKPNVHFSSMKDFAIRKSSCYDNCMVAMLAADLSTMSGLLNPFKKFHYPELLLRHFWNGHYFYDDLSKLNYVAADANIFPFILGIILDADKLEKALAAMHHAKLDEPFPLKYTASRKHINFIAEEFFLRNYESDSIWTHMGPLYIKLVWQLDRDKAAQYKQQYTELIEKYGNYLEVFSSKGRPFGTPFYYADRGMLWAANYLTL